MKDKLIQKAAEQSGEKPRVTLTDSTGEFVSPVYVGNGYLNEKELLQGWNLDPEVWSIIPGSLSVNRWIQSADSGAECFQYKARIEKKVSAEELFDVEPLVDVNVKVKTVRQKRQEIDLNCAVIFPDSQISFWLGEDGWHTTHDESALDVSRQVLADIQQIHGVDMVVDLGDFLDATHFSRHRSAPSQIDRQGFKKSVARGQQELAVRTALTPDAERWLIPGNHENRITLWLIDNAPWLMGLNVDDTDPVLSLEWLLQTGKHGWNVAEAYPEGAVYLNPSTRCIHGHIAKGKPGASAAEYLNEEINTFFGHTPRAQTVYRTINRHKHTKTYVASTAGGLMRVDGAVPSGTTATRITGDPQLARGERWDQGFTLCFYDTEGHTVPYIETISIFGGRAVWRGKVYEASVDVNGNPL